MSDNEEDYMSDKFLGSLTDVRPSLVHNRCRKRQIEVETKKAENLKRQREERLERSDERRNERLQTSLSRPIEADNKGFQLLAKMGYKPGTTLGSSANNSNAIKEPIGITLKSDRAGLGREAALQELAAKRSELHRQHLLRRAALDKGSQLSAEAYRMRATQKAEERKLLSDLRRCQQTCETLDQQAEVAAPELEFFWPNREPIENTEEDVEGEKDETPQTDDEEPLEEAYSNAEQLEMLTGYLRTAYKFCYWCGTRYENEEDLADNCPGLTRDEH